MKKAYLLPILAGILFASTGIFVRTLTQDGIDSWTLIFLRFSTAIIIMLIAILVTDKKLFKIRTEDLKLIIIASINILGLNFCYNYSTNAIPLSVATVLLSSAQVFVILFAYIAFREKITSKKIISMLFVIIGCILTTGLLEGSVSISLMGILAGIGSALFWANYMVASKKSLKEGVHTYTILFYTVILSTIVLIPFTDFGLIISYINVDIVPNALLIILFSALSFALPYILHTQSLNYIDSGSSAILNSGSEPLAALCYGMLIYSENPTILMFLGMIVTILALIILSKSES